MTTFPVRGQEADVASGIQGVATDEASERFECVDDVFNALNRGEIDFDKAVQAIEEIRRRENSWFQRNSRYLAR